MFEKRTIGTAIAIGIAALSTGPAVDLTTAPEASATTCVNRLSIWRVYNECAAKPARHWDAIRNAATKYGNWAGRRQWSEQSACWGNVVSYGYSLKR